MKSFFVTGTDTDAGKTTCSVALIHALRAQQQRCQVLKPIAAGAKAMNKQLRNDDALQLLEAAELPLNNESYQQANPYCFEPAIAPHIAAQKLHQHVNCVDLVQHTETLRRQCSADVLLIEGAGGWLVPLNSTETFADYAQQIHAPVILVVGMQLGCLNHALLTTADIERRGLVLAGWIANQSQPSVMAEYKANLATLKQRITAPCLGEVPYETFMTGRERAQYLDIIALL